MPRFIIIDNYSGYIWGDSADFDTGNPDGTTDDICEACRRLDHSIGEYERVYAEASSPPPSGYTVYRADINGSEAVGNIHDGQDPEMIAAVERDCEFVGYVEFHRRSDL